MLENAFEIGSNLLKEVAVNDIERKNYHKRRRKIESVAKQMLPVCYQNYTEYAKENGFDPEWRTGIAIDARDCAKALVDILEEL